MIQDSVDKLATLCQEFLSVDENKTLDLLKNHCADRGISWLEIHFASLGRKFDRQFVKLSRHGLFEGKINLASYRHCDLAAASLLVSSEPLLVDGDLTRLFFLGDAFERRMILKALPFLDLRNQGVELLGEAHRSNDEELFFAAFADSQYASIVLDDDDYYRAILKCAFIGLSPLRLIGAEARASTELSRMLLELVTEREAAGRENWPGTLPLAAHAPCPGLRSRVMGDLWHGEDSRRSQAYQAAATMLEKGQDNDLASELELRIAMERSAELKQFLEQVLAKG